MRTISVNGQAESVERLSHALAAALDGGDPILPLDAHDLGVDALRAAMRPDEPVEAGTAVIIATSGSTGAPKGVLLPATALIASAKATHTRLGGPGTWLLATPAHYIGGLQVLVRSLLARTTPGVVDLSTGFLPAGFAEAAGPVLRASGPHYTALVPAQLNRLLEAGGEALAAARSFDAIILGGAPTPDDLRDRAAEAGVRIISAYGMSETAGGCVYDGVPLDGVKVRVSARGDDDARRIEVSGTVLATGYRNDVEATRRSFVDGWFRTSDLGRLLQDGRLEVLGRADDVINTGGVKVPASVVERALLEHPGVRSACVVGLPNPDWGEIVAAAIVPADRDQPPASAELTLLVRRQAGAAAVPKILRILTELPLRGPGKVDRSAVRAELKPS